MADKANDIRQEIKTDVSYNDQPKLVAQIEFTEWTPDGHLRHSSLVGLRDDKEARQIVR